MPARFGPIVFARLTGLRSIDHQDCVRIVDDFLAVHRPDQAVTPAQDNPPQPGFTAGTGEPMASGASA